MQVLLVFFLFLCAVVLSVATFIGAIMAFNFLTRPVRDKDHPWIIHHFWGDVEIDMERLGKNNE